jgi:hypothetical protein
MAATRGYHCAERGLDRAWYGRSSLDAEKTEKKKKKKATEPGLPSIFCYSGVGATELWPR